VVKSGRGRIVDGPTFRPPAFRPSVHKTIFSKAWGVKQLEGFLQTNPRYSMGYLSLALSKRIKARHVGIWTILNLQEIVTCGFKTIQSFSQHLEAQFPIIQSSASKIEEGVLCTTDPYSAKKIISLLMVGESIENCQSYMKNLLPSSHPLFSI